MGGTIFANNLARRMRKELKAGKSSITIEAAEESAGGIVGVYKTMTNAEVQTALAVVGRITEAYRR